MQSRFPSSPYRSLNARWLHGKMTRKTHSSCLPLNLSAYGIITILTIEKKKKENKTRRKKKQNQKISELLNRTRREFVSFPFRLLSILVDLISCVRSSQFFAALQLFVFHNSRSWCEYGSCIFIWFNSIRSDRPTEVNKWRKKKTQREQFWKSWYAFQKIHMVFIRFSPIWICYAELTNFVV